MHRALVALGFAAATSLLALAAPAHADEASYLNHLHNAGIISPDGDAILLQVGWGICTQLANGASPDQLRAQALYNSDTGEGSSGIDPEQADDVVNYAMADLCPNPPPQGS